MALTAEQHELRTRGIGASDAAAALGFSKWKTPVNLYLEKLGEVEREDVDEGPRYWGQVLEDIVAKEYAKREGVKVRRRSQAIYHNEHDWMFAHIDRSVDGAKKVLECKTSTDWRAGDWGPDGSDEVPEDYLIQVQHEMSCTGYDQADLAVLIGNREFRIYRFKADAELIKGMIHGEREFWYEHVLKRQPPPPVTARDVLDLYPVDSGEQLLADPELEQRVYELAGVKEAIKTAVKQKEDIEQVLKTAMEGCSELLAPDGRKLITWKAPKPSQVTDWKALAYYLLEQATDEDMLAPDKLIARFTQQKANTRRFLVKF